MRRLFICRHATLGSELCAARGAGARRGAGRAHEVEELMILTITPDFEAHRVYALLADVFALHRPEVL